jgi:MATE family multidrug resistance protein
LFKCRWHIDWSFIKEAFRLGLPISFTLFFEIMAFCSVTLFVGKFGEVQSAANNIALNIGSLAFMIPMSIGAAVSVKIGHAFGKKNFQALKTFAKVALSVSIAFNIITGAIFYLFPNFFISLFSTETEVLAWGSKLLFYVACFQLFDGAQVTQAGVLRGLSITRSASLAVFFGYWIVGIPIGYYLGFHKQLEAIGFWQGLTISLAVVAVMLSVILKRALNKIKEEGTYVSTM